MTYIARSRDADGLTTLQQQVSRLFGGLIGDEVSRSGRRSGWVPAMDVIETPENHGLLTIKLPKRPEGLPKGG